MEVAEFLNMFLPAVHVEVIETRLPESIDECASVFAPQFGQNSSRDPLL